MKTPDDMQKNTQHDTNYYGKVQVESYRGCRKVYVVFLDTGTKAVFPSGDIRRGNIRDPSRKKVCTHSTPKDMELGRKHRTNSCGKVIVVNYYNRDKVLVRFEDSGKEIYTNSTALRSGFVRDPSKIKYVCKGIGANDMDNPDHYIYTKWRSMLHRCYVGTKSCYENVEVCDEWKKLSNFHAWMKNQDYEGLVLDKDLKSGDKKIYSPETCMFIPDNINSLITDKASGEHKRGVYYNKDKGLFQAQVVNPLSKKTEYLGRYLDEDSAHTAYRKRKYAICREICDNLEDKVLEELVLSKLGF